MIFPFCGDCDRVNLSRSGHVTDRQRMSTDRIPIKLRESGKETGLLLSIPSGEASMSVLLGGPIESVAPQQNSEDKRNCSSGRPERQDHL